MANSQSSLGAWLDSESSFRLTVEKAKEATEGSDYARNQYEKFHTAYLDAKKTLDQINKQNAEERNGLLDERQLIKDIMRMIGKMRFRLSFLLRKPQSRCLDHSIIALSGLLTPLPRRHHERH